MSLLACALLLAPAAWGAAPSRPDAAAALGPQAQALFQDINAFWSHEFSTLGGQYSVPALQLFSGPIDNVCSLPQALGAFYCPANQTVYIDVALMHEILAHTDNDEAAVAVVIGHEVAHYVQNLLGTTALVEQARSRSAPALSARTWAAEELQADCYAALSLQPSVASGRVHLDADPSALLEGIAAVSRERESHLHARQAMPDPIMTYGTAAQRLQWFENGLRGKGLADCDTFSAESAGKL